MARDRQSKGKKLRKSIYVFTEGYTEKNYFSILNKKYNRTATVKVSIHPTSKQGRCLLNHALGKISTLSNTEEYLDCEQYERNHKNDKDLLMQLEDLVSIAMEKTSSMEDLCQKTIVYEPYTNIGSVIRRIYDQDIY